MQLPTENVFDVLTASSLCHGLDAKIILEIADQCEIVEVSRGDYLWRCHSLPEFFALILSGIVRLTQRTPTGKEVAVEILGQGDCMGLLATLGNIPHPFSSMALSEVHFVRIPSVAWRELGQREPAALRSAVEEVVPRLLGGFGFMAFMAAADVEQRLALALLRLDDLNTREHGQPQPIRITRQSFADIVVTTVESAIRVTSKWHKLGVVRTRHSQIEVLDRLALAQIAGLSGESSVFSSSGVLTP